MQKKQSSEAGKNDVAKNKNVGPIIGFLIVAIVVVVTVLYLFASRINRQTIFNTNPGNMTSNKPNDIQTLKNDLNNAIK